MKSIVVFCASSLGLDPIFSKKAYGVGKFMAERNIEIIFGGSHLGLMGALANGSLENGGKVCGVLPRFMQSREIAHPNLTELILVDSMHERKLKMHELSDGIIALPGGFGTLEELTEMLTWAQLGLHFKPIGILNTANYYGHFIQFIDSMKGQGLLKKEYAELVLVADTIEELFEKMVAYEPDRSASPISKAHT